MAQNVAELTNEKDFENFIKDGFALVDFFADWCMPCLIMAPVIDELGSKFKGKIKFGKINVDENNDLARKFNVFSIPNFILFENGKIKEKFVGAMPIEDFEEKLKKHL
ncbi:MAG: thioredoxin [Candidatus Pacearchaeota archaeon]